MFTGGKAKPKKQNLSKKNVLIYLIWSLKASMEIGCNKVFSSAFFIGEMVGIYN